MPKDTLFPDMGEDYFTKKNDDGDAPEIEPEVAELFDQEFIDSDDDEDPFSIEAVDTDDDDDDADPFATDDDDDEDPFASDEDDEDSDDEEEEEFDEDDEDSDDEEEEEFEEDDEDEDSDEDEEDDEDEEEEFEEDDEEEFDEDLPEMSEEELALYEKFKPKFETHARKMAKENGQFVKANREKVEKFDKLVEEVEELKSQNTELSSTVEEFQVKTDPMQHPEIKRMTRELNQSVRRGLYADEDTLPLLDGDWGMWMDRVNEATNMEKQSDAVKAVKSIKLDMAKTLGLVDRDTSLLDKEIDAQAIRTVNVAYRAFANSDSQFEEVKNFHGNLVEKIKNGTLAKDSTEYRKKVDLLKPRLESVLALTEKDVKAQPNTLEALLFEDIADEKVKKQFEEHRDNLIDALAGPRVLDQERIDALVKSGRDINELDKSAAQNSIKQLENLTQDLLPLLMYKEELKPVIEEFVKSKREEKKKSSLRKKQKKTLRSKTKQARKKQKKKVMTEQEKAAEGLRKLGLL